MDEPKEYEIVILVRGDGVWGKAPTLDEALAKCPGGKPRYYEAFVAHPDAWVSQDGGLNWPAAAPRPKLVHQVLPKAAKAKARTR